MAFFVHIKCWFAHAILTFLSTIFREEIVNNLIVVEINGVVQRCQPLNVLARWITLAVLYQSLRDIEEAILTRDMQGSSTQSIGNTSKS